MSMSPLVQPIHIFRKDARHLWPETLVSIALLVAFAWAEAQTWQPSEGTFNPAAFAGGFLKFLLPVSWLVLTSRLVHDEELVGDRQFWITRPYTWYSLLGAKVLYLAVFIGVPFFAMQAWLLHHAGLYPTQLVPALLKNLLYIAIIFLLPLLAIAAVTATFVRYISSVLGGLIYLFTVSVIAAYNWPETFTAPYLDYVLSGTLLVLLLAALVVMYARRKTMIARLLLAALPLVILLFALLAPVNLLNAHRYPDVSVGKVTYAPEFTPPVPTGRLLVFQHKVELEFPAHIDFTGLPEKAYVEEQKFRITLDGPNGFHYISDWTEINKPLYQRLPGYFLPVVLPESVFQKIKDQPVSIHLVLGTQTYQAGTPYTVTATEAPFPAPGHATCMLSAESGALNCRYPFVNSGVTQVSATVHDGDCLNPGPRSATAIGGQPPAPSAPFGFAPVETGTVSLGLGDNKVPLCPGTPTTFTSIDPGAYGRMTVDIPAITLDAYARRIPVKPTGEPPTPQR